MIKNLYALENGQEAIITAIEGGRRHNLADIGLRVGKKIKVLTRQPLGGPIVVEAGEVQISVGQGLARKIKVEVNS